MEFFNSAVDTLQTIVVGLGGALCVWAVPCVSGAASTCWRAMDRITPAARATGGGVALIGVTLVPLLSGLLG